MNLDAKDFPLYQLLQQQDEGTAGAAARDFNRAQGGGVSGPYRFALRMQSLATPGNAGERLAGFDETIRQQTLRQCLAVFEDLAGQGNAASAQVAAECYVYGDGCAKDFNKARAWLDKAEDLGAAEDPMTLRLRDQLGPRVAAAGPGPG